eukprot:gene11785-24698_t
MEEGKLFLAASLKNLVGDDAIEGVVEYLSVFTEQKDMIDFLEEMCGKGELPSIIKIIGKYISMNAGQRQPRTEEISIKKSDDSTSIHPKGGNVLKLPSALKTLPSQEIKPAVRSSSSLHKTHSSAHDHLTPPPYPTTSSPIIATTNGKPKHNDDKNAPQKETLPKNPLSKTKAKSMKPQTTISECGCMGTQHKFLSSCSYCGRIVCERQGLGCCSFCGSYIPPPMSAEEALSQGLDDNIVNAYILKDKLLRFDQENTKRTHVHDAQ